jgi:hypothetical protein
MALNGVILDPSDRIREEIEESHAACSALSISLGARAEEARKIAQDKRETVATATGDAIRSGGGVFALLDASATHYAYLTAAVAAMEAAEIRAHQLNVASNKCAHIAKGQARSSGETFQHFRAQLLAPIE